MLKLNSIVIKMWNVENIINKEEERNIRKVIIVTYGRGEAIKRVSSSFGISQESFGVIDIRFQTTRVARIK